MQGPEGSLGLNSTDDDWYDIATHGPSVTTNVEQRDSNGAALSGEPTAKKLLELRPFQNKKLLGATVTSVPKPTGITVTSMSKPVTSKVMPEIISVFIILPRHYSAEQLP